VVLDLDGAVQPVEARSEPREADVTIGADGFSFSAGQAEFKLGEQV
jgi:hypothetical protein